MVIKHCFQDVRNKLTIYENLILRNYCGSTIGISSVKKYEAEVLNKFTKLFKKEKDNNKAIDLLDDITAFENKVNNFYENFKFNKKTLDSLMKEVNYISRVIVFIDKIDKDCEMLRKYFRQFGPGEYKPFKDTVKQVAGLFYKDVTEDKAAKVLERCDGNITRLKDFGLPQYLLRPLEELYFYAYAYAFNEDDLFEPDCIEVEHNRDKFAKICKQELEILVNNE